MFTHMDEIQTTLMSQLRETRLDNPAGFRFQTFDFEMWAGPHASERGRSPAVMMSEQCGDPPRGHRARRPARRALRSARHVPIASRAVPRRCAVSRSRCACASRASRAARRPPRSLKLPKRLKLLDLDLSGPPGGAHSPPRRVRLSAAAPPAKGAQKSRGPRAIFPGFRLKTGCMAIERAIPTKPRGGLNRLTQCNSKLVLLAGKGQRPAGLKEQTDASGTWSFELEVCFES